MALVKLLGDSVFNKDEKVSVSSLQVEGKVRANAPKTCAYPLQERSKVHARARVTSIVNTLFSHCTGPGLVLLSSLVPPMPRVHPQTRRVVQQLQETPERRQA